MNTLKTIKKYNIRFSKSLGQNFLIDNNILEKINNAVAPSQADFVIEVGAGTGSLTEYLSKNAGLVAAVEIDRHLMEALKENTYGKNNIIIINDDILKIDIQKDIINKYKKKNMKVKVAGNLPYYITTPIIMKFLENIQGIKNMVFMMQKEVASRLTAEPGNKAYGALTVAAKYYCDIKKLFDVKPASFIPKPDVVSTVLKFDLTKPYDVIIDNKEQFFKVIRACFAKRRKTLVNSLCSSGYFNIEKQSVVDILNELNINPLIRGEMLDISQFASLSNHIGSLLNKN